MAASSHGHQNAVEQLIAAGANINVQAEVNSFKINFVLLAVSIMTCILAVSLLFVNNYIHFTMSVAHHIPCMALHIYTLNLKAVTILFVHALLNTFRLLD